MKPWETIVCWYLQGESSETRVSERWCKLDFAFPSTAYEPFVTNPAVIGWTALSFAALRGHARVMAQLLKTMRPDTVEGRGTGVHGATGRRDDGTGGLKGSRSLAELIRPGLVTRTGSLPYDFTFRTQEQHPRHVGLAETP